MSLKGGVPTKTNTPEIVDQLCDARVLIDQQKAEIAKLRQHLNDVAGERNEVIQAVNTLRDQPSGEVWVKQEYSDVIFNGAPQGWYPAVTIGPEGKSMYVNAASLDRALAWFWKNTFQAWASSRQSDYDIPACRLINIRTGQTIPLTLRAVPRNRGE